jgi:cell division protein FtsB
VGRRFIPALLLVLLLLLQAQLWLGKGSLPAAASLASDLKEKTEDNEAARLRNTQIQAEVTDLKEGMGMVEERARQELGMVKPGEILVQIAK